VEFLSSFLKCPRGTINCLYCKQLAPLPSRHRVSLKRWRVGPDRFLDTFYLFLPGPGKWLTGNNRPKKISVKFRYLSLARIYSLFNSPSFSYTLIPRRPHCVVGMLGADKHPNARSVPKVSRSFKVVAF
jgi:hypothetical protein